MLQQVVTFTKAKILISKNKYNFETHTVSPIDLVELKALLGLLLISAATKSNHLPSRLLFDTRRSGTVFKACMTAERFNVIIKCLRFGDKQTREARKLTDKFGTFHELWDKLISNFQKWYTGIIHHRR